MKLFRKLGLATAALVLSVTSLTIALSGTAFADCFQYNQNGFTTSATPIFNNICGVPGIGNESNFVRIRKDLTGDDTDNSTNNPSYTIGTLTSH